MSAPRVVVLGAGLAGAACAQTLAGLGCRPVVVAPRAAVPSRGETLSSRALPSLEALGWTDLLEPGTATASGGRYSVWGGARLVRASASDDERPGWHVDRPTLEAAVLGRLAAAGLARATARATRVSPTAAGVVVELQDGAPLEADFVADCSGRVALSTAPGDRRRLDRLTACHAGVPLAADVEVADATLVEAVAGGWWYTSPMPGGRMAIAFFGDADLLPAGMRKDPRIWAGLAGAATATSDRLSSLGISLAEIRPQMAAAATIVSPTPVSGRIVRAGDAVAALDPLASNGLATALWSGVQAARAIAGLARGDDTAARRYEAAFLAGILDQIRAQAGMYAAERRFADELFWRRRAHPPAEPAPAPR